MDKLIGSRAARDGFAAERRWAFAAEPLEARTLFTMGALETSFGTGGAVSLPQQGAVASGAVIDAGGGKLLVGLSTGLVELDADGSLDAAFGSGGAVTTPFIPVDVRLAPGGKVVVAGTVNDEVVVARYDADGSPDATFGSGGTVTIAPPAGRKLQAGDFVVQSTGKVVVAATSQDPSVGRDVDPPNFTHVELFRVNVDGSLDATYGGAAGDGAGGVDLDAESKLTLQIALEYPQSMTLYPDDRVFVGTRDIDGFDGQEGHGIAYTVAADGSSAVAVDGSDGIGTGFFSAAVGPSGRLYDDAGTGTTTALHGIDGATTAATLYASSIGRIALGRTARGKTRVFVLEGDQVTVLDGALARDASVAGPTATLLPPLAAVGLAHLDGFAVVNGGADLAFVGSDPQTQKPVVAEVRLTAASDGAPVAALASVVPPRMGKRYGYATVAIAPGGGAGGALDLSTLVGDSLEVIFHNTYFPAHTATGGVAAVVRRHGKAYVTYAFSVPDKHFNGADADTYTFVLQPGAVATTAGAFNAGAVVGSYALSIRHGKSVASAVATPADVLESEIGLL